MTKPIPQTNKHEPRNSKFKEFYPIPYVKDLVITAPHDAKFNFQVLGVLPESEYLALDAKDRLRSVLEVIRKLENYLCIKIDYNVMVDDGLI